MRMERLLLAAGLALLAGCGANPPAAVPAPADGYSARCEPGEVQVMLLGTYHMDNPGQDGVRQEVDDVLAPRRQAELAALAARLAEFRPDQIAVEFQPGDSATLRDWYARYRSGTLQNRNEVVQIGMRVANGLGHEAVYPVDYQMRMWNDSIDALWNRRPEFQRAGDSITAAAQRLADAQAPRVRERTVIENLRHANSPPALGQSERWQWEIFLPVVEGDNYGGAQALGRWYERNLRMVQNLYRIRKPGTGRILLLVGSGHVLPLRALLDISPQFCPVSPLPYLR